ncbi:ankyrin repeat domain-containing protein [Novosphingobium profundi]|uniref:ankyrin repeat domain-containing protein n=1 Tax=Novosphingobium profundi TaxID=1774954 RepID=UPI001BDA6C78|nr:ankyrin repeat domain-containing protein [Novosphingobium profundi]MBT0666884.1 ankyrin repeat domain-containing protein [Novosphingobium profundi]
MSPHASLVSAIIDRPTPAGRGRFAGFAALLLAGTLVACGHAPGGDSDLAPEGAAVTRCDDVRADPRILAGMRSGDIALRRALASGGRPDPVKLASDAAARGDFRLAAVTSAKGVSLDLYNAQCRVLGDLPAWSIRALAYVPDLAAAEGRGADDPATAFGRAYNAALMGDSRYPYRDICRPVADVGPEPAILPDEPVSQPYGFADLQSDAPVDTMGYAARHNAVTQLRRLLAEHPKDIDKPDMFGLTPLAWAIAYQRWRTADVLIEAGASPTGAGCQSAIDRQSPLQVARLMRWSDMLLRLRPYVSEDQFASLRQNPRYDDTSLAAFNRAFFEIRQRYDPILRQRKFARYEMRFTIDEKGNSTSCEVVPASNSPAFDGELCEVAMKVVRWTPSRDAFGTTVPGDAKLVFGIGK